MAITFNGFAATPRAGQQPILKKADADKLKAQADIANSAKAQAELAKSTAKPAPARPNPKEKK